MTKSQQLLCYLIQESGGAIDDKTKLAKLEYFADFIHYAFNDKPISEETMVYQRRKQGPLARTFNDDLLELKNNNILVEDPPYHFKLVKKTSMNLSEAEKMTVHYVLKKYGSLSYNNLIDISHSQVPYLSSKEGGIVEYFTAYNLVDEYQDYESI